MDIGQRDLDSSSAHQIGRAKREAHVKKMCVITSQKDELPRNRWCLPMARMYHLRKVMPKLDYQKHQPKQMGCWNCSKEPMEHVPKSFIMKQIRIHRHTYVQLKVIARNPNLIHCFQVFCAPSNRFHAGSSSKYSLEVDGPSCRRSRTTNRTATLLPLSTSSVHQEVQRA